MREYQIGDIIGYNSPDEGYIYGRIVRIDENELYAEYLDDYWNEFCAPKDKADYIEPIIINDDAASKFARYEITAKDIIGDNYPPERVQTKEKYMLSIDDVITVLNKASCTPAERFKEEWFIPLRYTLNHSFSYGHPDMRDAGDSGYRFLPSEGFFVWDAIDAVDDCLIDGNTDFSAIIERLEQQKKDMLLPVTQRKYDDEIKAHYVHLFDKNNMLEKATDDELSLFVRYANELCEKNNKTALYAKAYGCYGGNRAFPCDWAASRDCLLKLMELDENPFLANTLGYIYYYGRCTNGEPEFDKAFKYYSIGAAGYVYESRYKLSDMFRHGYGVPKNNKVAASMIWELYNENIKYVFDGELNTKFADIALRAGNLFRDGIDCEVSPDNAYYCYLQADFAIRMRLLEDDHYGDTKVAASIRKAIEEILPETSFAKPKKTVKYWTADRIINCRHSEHRLMEMKIRRLKNGEYSIVFRVLPKDGEKYQPKLFVTEPEAHFSGLIERITAKTIACSKIKIGGRLLGEKSATVIFDDVDGDEFYLYGKKTADIGCDGYTVQYPIKEKAEKAHFVSVAFQPGGRSYDYLCNIPDITIGDKVIVETSRGETEVEVIRVFDKDSTETALPISKYKSILRTADK